MEPVIQRAIEFVKSLFAQDFGGHDYFHTLRVFRMALKLAQAEGADPRIVGLAALLHDADDVKLSPDTHEELGRAVAFLRENGICQTDIDRICRVIREVSFLGTDSVIPSTIEGQCVQDADRLDALGAIGIARAFAYGGSHRRALYDPGEPPRLNMTGEEYRRHRSTTVNHFHEKLLTLAARMNTPTARAIAAHRHRYMEAYLEEFLAEWDGTR